MNVNLSRTEIHENRADFENGKIININKPEGWTSFDVVKKIRNAIKIKKVGHAGTLDPFATGVLLVCTGKATKQVESFMGMRKVYVADVELGKVSDTYDRTGKITEVETYSNIRREDVEMVCSRFVGEIEQIPPMFSAIKIKGQRLYHLARQGINIERKPRRVHVYNITLLHFDFPYFKIEVTCGKGTYIRSLVHDIGQKLRSGAYIVDLVRTKIGQYDVREALTVPEFMKLNLRD